MHRTRILPFAALALFANMPSVQAAESISGIWKISTDMGDGTFQYRYLDLAQDGTTVKGKVVSNYHGINILHGTFEGSKLHLEVNPWRDVIDTYEGTLQGGKLNLVIATNQSANSHKGSKQATAVRDGGEGLTAPAPLPVPELRNLEDNGLARKPPMGWNSWNHFAGRVNDQVVRATADVLVSSGMKDAGYIYVNIDDTWQGTRDAEGNIQANKKFPDMKALSDYVHSKGLKIGIYSSPGPQTCGGYEGSLGHEAQDAKTYANWGFDYLKYDWCSAGAVYKKTDLRLVYQKMGEALAASGRPIVFSLCEYGDGDVWNWGANVSGNVWRTTGDISDRWSSLESIGFEQLGIAQYEQPGHFNDPDMLEVGNGGMSNDEYRTHMTLWALLSSPLLAGNDLEHMSKDTLELLTNPDVIAIDQDETVHHPVRMKSEGKTEVWTRELKDGAIAVALFNREDEQKSISVDCSKLGISGVRSAKNLWSHEDVKLSGDTYRATVPKHGVVLLRIAKS